MIKFFFKKYWLFLMLVVLISYGQTLFMHVWQDDNALFFKLAHISEAAGFLGKGLFGEGAYRYTATPYYFIYMLFGHITLPYFLLCIILYFLATLTIYKVFSKTFTKQFGFLASFLFAVGYVASDGFIRLYNSVLTSASIILISIFFYCYWNFYKKSKLIWYILSLVVFAVATELVESRTHYLIAVPFLFESIFFVFAKKKIFPTIARLSGFAAIFYFHFIRNLDPRSGQVFELVNGVLNGEFYRLFSFFTAISNLVIPDWISINLGKLLSFDLLGLFSNPLLSHIEKKQIIFAYLGIFVLVGFVFIFLKLKKEAKKLYLFFIVWALINIFVYAAYNQNYVYETVNRYLAHSFFAIIMALSVIFVTTKNKFVKTLIIGWGLINLVSGVIYQHNILNSRTYPAISFYNQLKSYISEVKRGDVFYFDVAPDSRNYFDNAFSVAQMPEETAIAWRYGVDRYDFRMFVDFLAFDQFLIENKVEDAQIHTFFYKDQELIETTDLFLKGRRGTFESSVFFEGVINSGPNISSLGKGSSWSPTEIIVDLEEPIISASPSDINVLVSAYTPEVNKIKFPLVGNYISVGQEIYSSSELQKMVFSYGRDQKILRSRAKVTSASEWQDRIIKNLNDDNPKSVWQGDRLFWIKNKEWIQFDFGKQESFSGLYFYSPYIQDSPTEYVLEVSNDGLNWKVVKNFNRSWSAPGKAADTFPDTNSRFWKITFTKTLGDDSPAISDFGFIPTKYKNLNLGKVDEFLTFPFGYVLDSGGFLRIIQEVGTDVPVDVYWQSDKYQNWQSEKIILKVHADGNMRTYSVKLPAEGTKISKLKFIGSYLPIKFGVYRIWSD